MLCCFEVFTGWWLRGSAWLEVFLIYRIVILSAPQGGQRPSSLPAWAVMPGQIGLRCPAHGHLRVVWDGRISYSDSSVSVCVATLLCFSFVLRLLSRDIWRSSAVQVSTIWLLVPLSLPSHTLYQPHVITHILVCSQSKCLQLKPSSTDWWFPLNTALSVFLIVYLIFFSVNF